MAEQSPLIQFDDIPLDEARRMGRGPRMNQQLYQHLSASLQSLSDHAVRMSVSDGTSQSTMKNRIQRVAAELGIPVTIRRISGGLLFWHSTDEDIQQAQEVGARLLTGRRGRDVPQAGRRPRGTR
jgi:hypothetical protein